MSKVFWNSLLISPALLGAALAVSTSAMAATNSQAPAQADQVAAAESVVAASQTAPTAVAPEVSAPAFSDAAASIAPVKPSVTVAQAAPAAEADATLRTDSLDQLNRYGREGRATRTAAMDALTSVSQLSDVKPTDWAFQALQSLVERYGCIVGYPDRTYRGNRALTRYEFAAGLNACMDRVNELIAASTADLVKKEDLATLQKLQEEFAAELATLRGRVDALEARTATLEKQQFSTTTKLAGEVIFAITDEFNTSTNNETVFQDRVRLAFNTSFTGKDLLVTRLAAGNAQGFAIPGGGAEGTQTFNFGNTGGNQLYADWVAYFFSVGENLKFYIPAVGGLQYDYAPTLSPALDAFDGGTGPLSVFAQRNPIYQIGGGSGIGVNFKLGKALTVSAGYLADNSGIGGAAVASANNPADKNGLFNGSYAALGQITFEPGGNFGLGLTYVNAYRKAAIFDTGNGGIGGVGTLLANRGNGVLTSSGAIPSTVNAYGVSGYFKLSPKIVINAFGTYVDANFIDDGLGTAEIWTYGAGLAFLDFGKKGNLLGLTAGVEPYIGNAVNNSLPIHVEGFYKYQLNDNISITPGVIYIINPGQNDGNDNVLIGTLRTTFTF